MTGTGAVLVQAAVPPAGVGKLASAVAAAAEAGGAGAAAEFLAFFNQFAGGNEASPGFAGAEDQMPPRGEGKTPPAAAPDTAAADIPPQMQAVNMAAAFVLPGGLWSLAEVPEIVPPAGDAGSPVLETAGPSAPAKAESEPDAPDLADDGDKPRLPDPAAMPVTMALPIAMAMAPPMASPPVDTAAAAATPAPPRDVSPAPQKVAADAPKTAAAGASQSAADMPVRDLLARLLSADAKPAAPDRMPLDRIPPQPREGTATEAVMTAASLMPEEPRTGDTSASRVPASQDMPQRGFADMLQPAPADLAQPGASDVPQPAASDAPQPAASDVPQPSAADMSPRRTPDRGLQPAPEDTARSVQALARSPAASPAPEGVPQQPVALRSGINLEMADRAPARQPQTGDDDAPASTRSQDPRERSLADVPADVPLPPAITDAAPAASGPVRERNTPPPPARTQQYPAPQYAPDAGGGGEAPAFALAGTAKPDAPVAAVSMTDDGLTSRDTARDPAIMAAANVTSVRQETYLPPVMPQQSPAQQIADRITGELAIDPPPAVERTASATGTEAQPVKMLHIQLNPPELGPLTIRMAMRNGALDLRLEAGQHSTAKLIERDREAISGMLRAAGYVVDGLTVQIAAPAQTDASSLFTGTGAQQQGQGQGQGHASGQVPQGWQQSGGNNPGQSWRGSRDGTEAYAGKGDETGEDRTSRVAGALYL